MAACGISAVSCSLGRSVAVCCTSSCGTGRRRAVIEMQGGEGGGGGVGALRTSASKYSFSALFSSYSTETRVRSGRSGRAGGRVFARHGVESAKEDVGLVYPKISSPSSSREFELFQAGRWSDAGRDELATLNDDSGRSAREALANRGEITEVDMDRLVEALLQEDGQSAEDYQRRAIFFNLIAEFFRQGKAYSAEKDEARIAMQMLVDSILAEDGRSATDYNARAQFFAKSAEVFPFNAEVGQM